MVEPEIKDVTIVLSNRIIVSESNPNHKNGIKEVKKNFKPFIGCLFIPQFGLSFNH